MVVPTLNWKEASHTGELRTLLADSTLAAHSGKNKNQKIVGYINQIHSSNVTIFAVPIISLIYLPSDLY